MKQHIGQLPCTLLAILIGLASPLAAVEDGSVDVRFAQHQHAVTVPVELFDHVVYVPVRIDGGPVLSFVLDTGAPELSVLEMERAAELGLQPLRTGRAEGAGDSPVRFFELGTHTMQIGDLAVAQLRLAALSLIPMEGHWGRPKDGLVGGNLLGKTVSCIDYDRSTLSLHDPAHFDGEGRGRRVPLEVEDNAMFVRAAVVVAEGQPAVIGRFLIDTAVRQSFLNTPFVNRHQVIEGAGPTIENITGYGLGGEAFGTLGRLHSFILGGHRIEGPVLQLCTETSGAGASRRFDGIIGADLLSRFQVCLDPIHSTMWIEPGASFPLAAAYDASGLVFVASGSVLRDFEVLHVVPSSAAATAGVRVGDRLVSIDDRPASDLTLDELKRELTKAGRAVTLELARDGKSVRINFTLQALL